MQFVCDDDFILFGEFYINCVNNIWVDFFLCCVGKQIMVIFNLIYGFIMYNYNSCVFIKLVNMYFQNEFIYYVYYNCYSYIFIMFVNMYF